MDDVVNKIVEATDMNDDEKKEFIDSVNSFLLSKTLMSIYQHDRDNYEKIIKTFKTNAEGATAILEEVVKNNSTIKIELNSILEKFIDELGDLINQSSTAEQKQQIIASL